MPSVPRLVLAGALAAGVATYAKTQAEGALQPLAEKVLPPQPGQKTAVGADPAGHPENMPPSELADQTLHAVTGDTLSDDQREQASEYLHWVMGVGSGVAYAVGSAYIPQLRVGRGVGAGALLFAATHGSALPLAGVQHPPTKLPRAWWLWEGGSHLVYGAVLDTALRVTTKLTRAGRG